MEYLPSAFRVSRDGGSVFAWNEELERRTEDLLRQIRDVVLVERQLPAHHQKQDLAQRPRLCGLHVACLDRSLPALWQAETLATDDCT